MIHHELDDPDLRIFIVIAILSVLFLSKIALAVSLATLVFGVILFGMRGDKKKEAVMVIICSVAIICISYFIGFIFEPSIIGQSMFAAIGNLIRSFPKIL